MRSRGLYGIEESGDGGGGIVEGDGNTGAVVEIEEGEGRERGTDDSTWSCGWDG